MNIDSNTKVTGIIGYPLKKTLSPLMQNTAFNALDLNWSYIPMPVKKENLGEAIKGLKALGFKGINVTMPHKEEVIKYLSEVSDYAKIAGAVNTIHFEGSKAIGYNTDGRGFLHALERDGGFSPEGKSALILGAGGAACSIAIMLAMNKIKVLTIVNRTIENAKKLANNIKSRFNDLDIKALSFSEDLPKLIDSADLIVNSTPVGWEGGLIIEPDLLHKKHLVMDLVYMPEETELLREAKARGARILPGKLMLLYQGASSFEIWTKAEAPIEQMREALDKSLSESSRR